MNDATAATSWADFLLPAIELRACCAFLGRLRSREAA
jgi:hypothetical protein